ncbi:MAG: hypothetical protein RIR52_1241 [Acidobacteriota bacterium]
MVERLPAIRIVATPAALDQLGNAVGGVRLRTAPDELLLIGERTTPPVIADPHAIIFAETGFVGRWIPAEQALEILARTCEWELPVARPAFAQGMVAGLPVRLWLEPERILFITAAPFAVDLEERVR